MTSRDGRKPSIALPSFPLTRNRLVGVRDPGAIDDRRLSDQPPHPADERLDFSNPDNYRVEPLSVVLNFFDSQICLSLDLEVDGRNKSIRAIGAVRSDAKESLRCHFPSASVADMLTQLDAFADGATFVLGHNLINFDLPCLKTANPNLRLLILPAVDTLRLNPLAFPRYPYHSLVKHYQDFGIKQGRINDPELDSRLALEVFKDQLEEFEKLPQELLAAWHWLCTPDGSGADRTLDDIFTRIRQAERPSQTETESAIAKQLQGKACTTQGRQIVADFNQHGWNLAYALAWLYVSGGNSTMPPWVRHQFPDAGQLVRRLRDTACASPECGWCQKYHNPQKELNRWFGFDDFRPRPATADGRSLQQAIVEAAVAGQHVFGILPTGTGKSICYQVPALSKYYKIGALTVVISPLVALMADQVAGLEKHGVDCCVTINGLLSMPERSENLERVKLGDAGILLISPEQLRSSSLVKALNQREIGAWVLDEAHCLSRWGHDFRPDYRYVGRFIRKQAGDGPIPPVLCLTATAKPDVIDDIARHFREKLDIELTVFDGGSRRSNLEFQVVPVNGGDKYRSLFQILDAYHPPDQAGGVIVYCATRNQSEEIAEYLKAKMIAADRFHAGLPPETKKDVQDRFIAGDLRAIAATNAFGMGIDKPDVRLVIHADIPGSLENYLQEAGRAGRDNQLARCVLLYSKADVERQFSMSANFRLTRREIHGILRALRNLNRHKRFQEKVIATPGEILDEDLTQEFERDSVTDDNRVRTAVAWLEESRLLEREENFVQMFPSSLRIETVEEAKRRLAKATITEDYRRKLLNIARYLIEADPDEGISTDQLMGCTGLDSEGIRNALHYLEKYDIASNDTALTAFVHKGVRHASRKRFQEANDLEDALIECLQEKEPDPKIGISQQLHLRVAAQKLRDRGLTDPLPERIWRLIRSIARDDHCEEDQHKGSLEARKWNAETATLTLLRKWELLRETAKIRRTAAELLLQHLLDCLPSETRGTDLLAETTFGKLMQAMVSDLDLKSKIRNPSKLMDRALLWLHEQEVLRLHKGLAVFRPAMTIKLDQRDRNRGFSQVEFKPLSLHYQGQILQIHVMAEYAEIGLKAVGDALRLAMDYFSLKESDFLQRWLPGRDKEIGRQTTPESWAAIVESLNNTAQQRIVADQREQTNVLVLAGPGSGKTRVLVHRIAFLVRVRREKARGILALAYNRHAAVEIRRRLKELLGDDTRQITVLTCHALAMRLAGYSFNNRAHRPDQDLFKEVMWRAVALLRGEDLPPGEADERRERLLAGFRWILVDEYQDVGAEQYELISTLAGRTLQDDSSKLTLFAVGDDDQNIYSFAGASVKYIQKFQSDYGPRPVFLTDNYRSTAHIVEAANAVIKPAEQRMKVDNPIKVDRARAKETKGGDWHQLDPVSEGRVQILPAGNDPVYQARAVMAEFQRLAGLVPGRWDWTRCAVIARQWKYLNPIQAFCEVQRIPVQLAKESIPNFWHLRETKVFVEWLRGHNPRIVDGASLRNWTGGLGANPWNDLLRQAVEEYVSENGDGETPVDHILEWLAEWGREIRRRSKGLLLLTAHRAKGLEFDHVIVLDGDWKDVQAGEDPDASRRLYYVAMTRARHTLTLARFNHPEGFQDDLRGSSAVLKRDSTTLPPSSEAIYRHYLQTSLKDLDLGFAGRHHKNSSLHAAIASLSPGDSLTVKNETAERWELLDLRGRLVGRLTKSFQPPQGMRPRSIKVFAIIDWSRESSDVQYQDSIKCDQWEVVMPEFVFEPNRR